MCTGVCTNGHSMDCRDTTCILCGAMMKQHVATDDDVKALFGGKL